MLWSKKGFENLSPYPVDFITVNVYEGYDIVPLLFLLMSQSAKQTATENMEVA